MRCLKSKTQCAYRDQTDLNFRNQTDSTAKAAQIKWRQRAKQQIASDPKSSEPDTDSQGDQSSKASDTSSDVTESIQQLSLVNSRQNHSTFVPSLSNRYPSQPRQRSYLSRKVDPPLEATAIGLLFSDYIIAPTSVAQGGFFDFLPNMYAKSRPDSALRSTVNTMALANIANKHDLSDLKIAATAGYCQTLKLLGSALQSPSKAVLDETLLTTVLLMIYEVIIFPMTPFSGKVRFIVKKAIIGFL